VVDAGLLELDMAADHIDDVDAGQQFLDKAVGNHGVSLVQPGKGPHRRKKGQSELPFGESIAGSRVRIVSGLHRLRRPPCVAVLLRSGPWASDAAK
jgi:hypothetical protein